MTPGFVLDELDLDLATAGLLVRLWLVVFIVVVRAAVCGVMVIDERVVVDGLLRKLLMHAVLRRLLLSNILSRV
jgi:hypothetical protein